MRTKRSSYAHTISTMITTDMRNKIIELATKVNISQGEFVRDAVEHYISYLADLDSNRQELYQALIDIGEKDYE